MDLNIGVLESSANATTHWLSWPVNPLLLLVRRKRKFLFMRNRATPGQNPGHTVKGMSDQAWLSRCGLVRHTLPQVPPDREENTSLPYLF